MSRDQEAGFTLIEALIAVMILSIGLIAVANLLVVGAASNTIGNHSTNTTAIATETLERLRNIPFATGNPPTPVLVAGGDLEAAATCDDDLPANNCVRADNFHAVKNVPGVGQVHTTWEVTRIDGQTYFLRVRSESTAVLARRRARAEFTTIRSCTSTTLGCPPAN
jgi:prepilin-type N-terminal cleavage/methylation domain-containing protein